MKDVLTLLTYIVFASVILATVAIADSTPGRGTATSNRQITGMATYYTVSSARSEGTSGILTASGKRYDESKMTCALPKQTAQAWGLKFGQKVRVTNMANGRTALLTYTDRGPGLKSRSRGTIIDLTPAAFRALGGKLAAGKIKVKVERKKPCSQN